MANKQFEILKWIYDNRNNFPLKSGKIYQAYQETESYKAGQNTFSEILSKLNDKGFLEKPEYGVYNISENGENRVLTLRGKDLDEFKTPENYGAVVDELVAFLMTKDDKVHSKLVEGSVLRISLKEVDRFNSEVVYEFMRENFGSFVDAFGEALSEVVIGSKTPDWEFKPDLEYLESDLKDSKSSKLIREPVIVEGLIRKTRDLRPKVVSAVFECTQCGELVEKDQDSAELRSPYKCPGCGSRKFDVEEKVLVDTIDFELSQRDEKETKMMCIYDNASPEDSTKLMSGKRVKLLAIPKERQIKKNSRKMDVYLEVHSYDLTDRKLEASEYSDEDKKEVIRKIEEVDNPFKKYWSSLAPQVADRNLPKKCIAVSTMGSPTLENLDSEFGRIHIGVMSNPGMAKSGLLKSVRNIFNNVYRSAGGNATGTALTGAAEQTDGGEWEIVAGKVVFADKGFLQIDEFDKFKKGELVKLNSAMEEGYFPIDKGTVKAELPGRATIMLSGNFSRKLDVHTPPYKLLPEKAQGLYDRIPLLCAITENSSEVTDKVLQNYSNGPHSEIFEPYFSGKELRIYRDLGRKYSPEVSEEAQKYIKNFYDGGSGYSEAKVKGKSMRPLVNLMKITMAMARFDLSEKATRAHAKQACKLVRECKSSLGLKIGEKPGEKLVEDMRLKHFDKAYENLTSEKKEMIEIPELEDRYTSVFDHDSSEFQEALDRKTHEGEYYEPEQGKIKVMS